MTAGLAGVLSEYVWARALWAFWGEYWPDGYVAMAHQIFNWLAGTSTFAETRAFISSDRNGCNFLPPLLIALLHGLGFRYITAYATLSLVFSFGTLVVLFIALRPLRRLTNTQCAFLILVTGLNLVVVRGFIRPLTDAGGMFFTVVFVAALRTACEAVGGPLPPCGSRSLPRTLEFSPALPCFPCSWYRSRLCVAAGSFR